MAKILFAFVIVAIIAATANAGMMLERYETFLDNRSYANFVNLVCYQFWGFLSPFMKGALDVVLKYIWEQGVMSFEYESNTTVSLAYSDAFGFIGVGNLK